SRPVCETAMLELAATATRTRFVAPDLGAVPALRKVLWHGRKRPPVRLKIAVDVGQPRDHRLQYFLTLFGRNGRRPHLRVGILLIMQHHDRYHGPAVIFIVNELAPACRARSHAAHETMRPVVTGRDAIFSFEKHR